MVVESQAGAGAAEAENVLVALDRRGQPVRRLRHELRRAALEKKLAVEGDPVHLVALEQVLHRLGLDRDA